MSAAAETVSGVIEALDLAALGIPVFPCKPTKAPYTTTGFKDASTDPDTIGAWWLRWPDALVGVPTGEHFIVVDIDPDGADWYSEHSTELQAGRIHKTRRGWHLLYTGEPEIRCSASKIAPGVDVRGHGGYIVWWPAHGLDAVGELDDIGPLPDWLRDATRAPERPQETRSNAGHTFALSDWPRLLEAVQRIDVTTASYDDWLRIGMALHATGHPDAFNTWDKWSQDDPRYQGRDDLADRWRGFNADRATRVTPATVFKMAGPQAVTLADFRAHMPTHAYIFMPARDLWPASSVDARVEWPTGTDGKAMKPSRWLDRHAPVEQMTWSPGAAMLIDDKLIDTGGWIHRPGCTTFNLYRPPTLEHGDARKAAPWIEHVRRVYPDDAEHLIRWLAHRVQHPGEKINHALVMGGKQGIGKDTILEPVKSAVGPWNCHEVAPSAMLGRFNGFVKSVILRISEARDLGDVDRFAFYDHSKGIIAAPPDVIRCDEKNIREHPVPNVCGVIITTNHKSNGLFLPADDRRHYVAWSELDKDHFQAEYWRLLWNWYADGGIGHVAAYLADLDLADFDPKAPPPKTEAFWHVVNANRAPEESELADILDGLGWPGAVTLGQIVDRAGVRHAEFAEWLGDRRNRRQIPHRLENAGYEPVRNPAAKDGYFVINGKRQAVYAKSSLNVRERHQAAARLST